MKSTMTEIVKDMARKKDQERGNSEGQLKGNGRIKKNTNQFISSSLASSNKIFSCDSNGYFLNKLVIFIRQLRKYGFLYSDLNQERFLRCLNNIKLLKKIYESVKFEPPKILLKL